MSSDVPVTKTKMNESPAARKRSVPLRIVVASDSYPEVIPLPAAYRESEQPVTGGQRDFYVSWPASSKDRQSGT
jgi:hypothetical protein